MFPDEIKKKPFEYLLLFFILSLGAFAFIFLSYTPHAQRRVIYLTGASYLFWSLMHHYKRGDLSLSIMLEYLLIALFAAVLITTTLF